MFAYVPELPKLSGQSGEQLGSCLAISGDGNTAVIGADLYNPQRGGVWAYVRQNDGSWVQQGDTLKPSDVVADFFGTSCSISDSRDTIMVGGTQSGSSVGGIWPFIRLLNGTWVHMLVGTDHSSDSNQGYSVALSADGNVAITGGIDDNRLKGSAWIFNRSAETGEWSQVGNKLVPNDASRRTVYFGSCVSLSADGSTALIGGPQDSSGYGAAWIFTRLPDGAYAQAQPKLLPSDNIGTANFGSSVHISSDGSTAVIGGPDDDDYIGSTWAFQRLPNGNYVQLGEKLVANDFVGKAEQGAAVCSNHDGSIILTGGPGDGGRAGAVWVFYRYSNHTYIQQESKLQLPNSTMGQGGVLSMDANGDRFISGQPGDLEHGEDSDGSVVFWQVLDLNPIK